jgi:hypothetical protein
MLRTSTLLSLILLTFLALAVAGGRSFTPAELSNRPEIPKTWDDSEVASMEIPLVAPGVSPVHMSSGSYYGIPVQKIYKSYPIYRPDREPPGYMDWLKQQEPEEIVFDSSKFKTKDDWIKAGEMIFDEPLFYDDLPTLRNVQDPTYYAECGIPVLRDGTVPFTRYVVREKGKIEVGSLSCAICHTRVMPDGSVIKGAQGNFPFDKTIAFQLRMAIKRGKTIDDMSHFRQFEVALFDTPWLRPNPHAQLAQMSIKDYMLAHDAIPAGVVARERASLFFPAQVPDLIGLKDRLYFDHTGLVRHRSIADVMRYAAAVQTGDDFAYFGDFREIDQTHPKGPIPDGDVERYTDEQLYALALFLYSLNPPPNPKKFDALAARGNEIFKQEGCASCHTPPLYTNNRLTPAGGFTPREDHLKKYDVLPGSVGTDPNLALNTRRGTGYYKVPSLRGVWYRGPFEHSGSVASLEDWFDPRRIRDDYVRTGFRDFRAATGPVKGHRFGLDLSAVDRKALIAFLRTL